jgi:hypothetical protein
MKLLRFVSITIIVAFTYISLFCALVFASEVKRPDVNKIFSREKETKIQTLKSLRIKEAFESLKEVEFLINRDFKYKAIYTAFNNRKSEAISLAESYLTLPLIEVVEGRRVNRVPNFNIARKIFEVFPDESTPVLTNLYKRSDAIKRGNIIRACGGVSGGQPIEDLLIKALDDKSFAEEETPEMMGEPLRVCDIAYNQLVLRYGVRNVLRTISSAHRIETRDYHIQMLKNQL